MKELIRFSLIRRFNNRSTKVFNAIVCIVILCFCFADKVMEVIHPSMFEPTKVYTVGLEDDFVQYLNDNANEAYQFVEKEGKISTLVEKGDYVLKQTEKEFVLYTKYESDTTLLLNFSMYINAYRKDKILQNSENALLLLEYNKDIPIKNVALEKQVDLSEEKSNLIFMFVTSVYFMMISFVSTVASEVVNEKATKTLELILTSVHAKVHFLAKLLVGWLVIVIQGIMSLSYGVIGLFLRNVFDQGKGLIAFAKKINMLKCESATFISLIKEVDLSYVFFQKLALAVLFLMMGILFVQLLMVIVSSFVSSVEEAGNIHAPFYLVLLGFYYLVMAINTPDKLNEGIGYYLSFCPFFNMLLMPCRLLISNVAIGEIVLSLSLSIVSILMILYIGIPIYEIGVLDYSCKGYMQIVRSIYQNKNTSKEVKKKVRLNLFKYRDKEK